MKIKALTSRCSGLLRRAAAVNVCRPVVAKERGMW